MRLGCTGSWEGHLELNWLYFQENLKIEKQIKVTDHGTKLTTTRSNDNHFLEREPNKDN